MGVCGSKNKDEFTSVGQNEPKEFKNTAEPKETCAVAENTSQPNKDILEVKTAIDSPDVTTDSGEAEGFAKAVDVPEAVPTTTASADVVAESAVDTSTPSEVHKEELEYSAEKDQLAGTPVRSEAFYAARNRASAHARRRGELFEQSKAAFARGDKAEAKDLSEQGKREGLMMEEAHAEAVREILEPQNLSTSSQIDLHALQVAEAVQATKDFVLSWKAKKETAGDAPSEGERSVTVITGAGHHSDPKKGPVIKPAIAALCQENGWTLTPLNEGSFTLTY